MALSQQRNVPVRSGMMTSGVSPLRKVLGISFTVIGILSIIIGLGVLAWLIISLVRAGAGRLTWDFLTTFDSRFPNRAGLRAAVFGTLYAIPLTIFFSVPLGIAAALYLEEYERSDTWVARIIELNINNLAGVPSIIFGLLGLQVFARWLMLERGILTGALTLALVVLPVVIVSSREALRAVPRSLRQASFGLGATRWQTVRHHVLPNALPGMLTGTILAAARAIGETAPLITIGALTYVPFVPRDIFDRFTVLPIQIFNWTSRPQEAFRELAAAGSLVLLIVLLGINGLAVILRQRLRKPLS